MTTNLSANWPMRFIGEPKTETYILDTSVAQHVYAGSPLVIDDNGDTEHLIDPTLITIVINDCMVGIAAHEKIVAAGDPETYERSGIEVYVEPTIVGFKGTTYSDADLGLEVSMNINGVLAATGAGKPRIGKLYKVEDGYQYVQLETPWVQAA
jgi:hypothetical protein